MTKADALRIARKRWGPSAWVEDRGGSSSEEARAWAREEARRLQAEKPIRPDIASWPEDATIGEFRAAVRAFSRDIRKWQARIDPVMSQMHRYRYLVGKGLGTGTGVAFRHVLGAGDTWEEAIKRSEP